MQLTDPVTEIPGVGLKYKDLLKNLNIESIEDLLWHIPFRYEDRSNIKKISELIPNEKATVIATVEKINNVFTRYGKRLTNCTVSDETGQLSIVWFNQIYLAKSLPIGSTVKLYGQLNPKSKKPQFTSPEYELVKEPVATENSNQPNFLPVYPTTSGISNNWLRARIEYSLKNTKLNEILSEEIINKYKLPKIEEALKEIHNPDDANTLASYRKRLAFEELLFLHLNGISLRSKWENKKNSHKIKIEKGELEKFKKNLPFELTKSQDKSIDEILSDLNKKIPMNRLLQGDVGSGKTVVAAAAILAAAQSNFNTVLMAPTQILAEQHYNTLKKVLTHTNINVILLTGKSKPKEIKEPYIVVATHAILHNLESFNKVGLIIVDEQHKFGVQQRTIVVDHYTEKNHLADKIPNLLTMTATPIPRSLALTFYGDLNLSVINELPKSRKGIKTWVINETKRKNAYKWIGEQITDTKIQAFVVCPFIEESGNIEFQNVRAAELEYEKLKKIFPKLKVGLLHGRMKNDEKSEVISKMLKNEINILVTTPVIEVGVDIPNANIMFIESPERFGLASLHQLRGRVGRGNREGYCFLITSSKSPSSIERLKYMETIHNGNELAEIDLKMRGPGDIYGTNQHGFIDLKVADIGDIELIKDTKSAAEDIFKVLNKYPEIERKLQKRYVEEN